MSKTSGERILDVIGLDGLVGIGVIITITITMIFQSLIGMEEMPRTSRRRSDFKKWQAVKKQRMTRRYS